MKRLEESVRFCGDSLPFEASAKLGPRRRADGWREGICGGTAFSGHRRASHRLAVPAAPGTPTACPSKLQRSRVLVGRPMAREREFAKGIRKGDSQRGFAKGIRKGDSQRGFAKALLSLSIAIRVAVPRSKRPQYPISNPLRNGIISDWKIARPSDILQLCFRGVAAKTESHRKIAEQMSFARARASSPAMSRAEFLAQTPKELRVSRPGGLKSRKSSER
jgi:hypothetical protein